MRRFLTLSFAVAAIAACSSNVGSSEDFATDTFSKPTHHGELDFQDDNRAEFSNSQRFHGWSFSLTGNAKVKLNTDLLTPNLDTVLYLYKATEEGKKTGRNLRNNDNGGDDGLSSIIEAELEEGTYFIQVKTKNVAMRGDFNLEASCIGAGCPIDAPPTPADYCEGAIESIGKCQDDTLEELSEEECAPHDSDGIVCCNSFEDEHAWCDQLCGDGDLNIARVWNDNFDAAFQVFPEGEFTGLEDAYSYALSTCASPDLDEVARDIVAGSDIEAEDDFTFTNWIDRDASNFFEFNIDTDLLSVLDATVGEKAASRFEATVEVPCPNCTDGYTIHGFFYPTVGKVVVLQERWGGDS